VRAVPTWIVSMKWARANESGDLPSGDAADGVAPDEIFYVDDRLDLIEAGRALGLRAEPFISAQRLRTQLARWARRSS